MPAAPKVRLRDNPTGDKWVEFLAGDEDPARYRVNGNVGPHTTGAVVSAREMGPGAQS
jgi:hypothetical protein